MSRSHFKKPNEEPIAKEVIVAKVLSIRHFQTKVYRKSPHGHTRTKRAKVTLHYPPVTGWPGGDPLQNRGFRTPQK